MCEKLMDHVGEFKAHATNHFQKIVDSMHNPSLKNTPHEREKGMAPLQIENITEDKAVFLDEDDDALYYSSQVVEGE